MYMSVTCTWSTHTPCTHTHTFVINIAVISYVAVRYSAQIPHVHPPPHEQGSPEEMDGNRPSRQLVTNLNYQRRICVCLHPPILMMVWPLPLLWGWCPAQGTQHGLLCPHINRVTHPLPVRGRGCGDRGRSEGVLTNGKCQYTLHLMSQEIFL